MKNRFNLIISLVLALFSATFSNSRERNKKIALLIILVVSFFIVPSLSYACGSTLSIGECNEVGERCCSENGGCCRDGLQCDSGRCANPCGSQGQNCCSGSRCNNNNLLCVAGKCKQKCQTREAGCYKTGDVSAATGTIKPSEFGYYLPSKKCINIAPPNPCGNGKADSGEECNEPGLSCPSDKPDCAGCKCFEIPSGPICGVNGCESGEDSCSCPSDCPGQCFASGASRPSPESISGVSNPITGMVTGRAISDITGQAVGTPLDCACPSGYSPDVEEQANADQSQQSCGCVRGTAWNDDLDCCGDDPLDCGNIEAANPKLICSMPLQYAAATPSAWIDASTKKGEVIKIGCNGASYLSDGTRWLKCDHTFPNGQKKVTVDGHEYLCMGFGTKSIAECCGGGNCKASDTVANLTRTGQFVNPSRYTSTAPPVFNILNLAQSNAPSHETVSRISNPITGMATATATSGFSTITGMATESTPAEQCGGGVGASCDAPGGEQLYKEAVNIAINSFLSANPEIANTKNDVDEAVSAYLTGVAELLKSNGFIAGRTINCNGNEGSDSVMVGKPTDQFYEYYDIIVSSGNGALLKDSGRIGYWEKAGKSRLVPSSYTGFGNNTNYYCRADGTFTTRLDSGGTGPGWVNPEKNKEACQKAGYRWTGTKCCGEPGTCEYYNDPGQEGGCWRSAPVISVSYVNDSNKSAVNYAGSFHGCAISKNNYNKANNAYLTLVDRHTGKQLVEDHDYCFNDPKKEYFCSYTEQFLPTQGKNRTKLSTSPAANPAQLSECCSQSECWNGDTCIANQKNNPLAQPLNDKRCIDGQWTSAFLRYTPDESASGYCPAESQCLLNPLAQPQNQCVPAGSYSNDNYCENGIWSTRTKLLALKLLSMKSGNYVLFCDNRENVANNLQYFTETNEPVAGMLQNMDANNFCAMSSNNKVIGAVSINKDIETIPGGISIFRVTSCSNALIDDGQYHPCDSSNKVWYNKRLKSLIYSSGAISVPAGNPSDNTDSFIRNPILFIVSRIRALINPTPTPDTYYVDRLKKFDKLYLSEQGTKTIKGVVEGINTKNLVLGYSGFSFDICSFISMYNDAHKDASSGIACRKEGNNYYVLAQGNRATNINPDTLWIELTAKMRTS